ncbi:hypothetical protein V5T82_14675 [Magnetovibrio sp. PR-2]|uniref:hypothetical protein n=1 Tax=Magnetovibrio sp. PR-2 TaxID=3120356 RepID=UPI002FCE23DE
MKLFQIVCAVSVTLGLGACIPTQVKPVETDAQGAMQANDRTVQFHVSEAYYQNAPDCAIIKPIIGNGPTELTRFVEKSVARQLTGKVERVITPLRRDRLARKNGYDLSTPADFKSFARTQRCAYHVTIELQGSGDQYAVIWSDKHVGVKMELLKTRTDEVLWRGAHVARRGDGGVPLSPLSILANAAKAASFSADTGLVYSIANDAVRRILTTLPDIR